MKNQNGLALFNAIKEEAKSLGIDTTGMKKAEIEAAIAAKQEVEPQISNVVIEITNEGVTKKKGRPVDPNSPRQIRIVEKARLREEGLLRRGRPEVEGSARQQRMQARAAKLAAGISIKPGRPKVNKVETVATMEE